MLDPSGSKMPWETGATPWIAEFLVYFFLLIYTHMGGSSRVFVVRASCVISHLHALICLFIILSFFLPINFIFHECGGQIPCALSLMRILALLPSTALSQTKGQRVQQGIAGSYC